MPSFAQITSDITDPGYAGDQLAPFIMRDLKNYFAPNLGNDIQLNYELLMSSGTSFFVWVKVLKENGTVKEGLAQLSGSEKDGFHVNFEPAEDVYRNEKHLSLLYSAEICPSVKQKIEAIYGAKRVQKQKLSVAEVPVGSNNFT
jgi:hypothetical protein